MDCDRFYFGIDLGTTNSVAACYDAAKKICTTLQFKNGSSLLKSQVWLDDTNTKRVGSTGEYQEVTEVIKDVKSSMMLNSSFRLGKGELTAVQVSADVLQELKELINKEYREQVGHEIKDVTITVPAAFNNIQRSNTLQAASLAGLNVVSLINEPTAAALAYVDRIKKQETVMIYDLGGGTFDVSIVSISPKIPAIKLPVLGIDLPEQSRQMVNVLRSDGDTHLGGNDLDRCMVEIAMQVKGVAHIKPQVFSKALEKAQKLKEHDGKGIESCYAEDDEEVLLFDSSVYEAATDAIFEKTQVITTKLMSTMGSTVLDRIVFVGGSTKNKYLCQRVGRMFAGVQKFNDINPDECVAVGAAMNSYIMSGTDDSISFTDIVPSSLGILVTSSGTETFNKMLLKGEPLPAMKTISLQKATREQKAIQIPVYQGENIAFKQNHMIGELVISGIPYQVTVNDEIQCTLKVNKSGVLSVTAKLLGEEYKTEIDMSSIQITEAEQDEMLSDLEDFITHEFS